ncbi:hypothetical protein BGZ65_012320, partial [Modicella reniformis]
MDYTVEEAPSTGSSVFSVHTEDGEDDIVVGSPESVPTVTEVEERGEILRRAAEVLDPQIYPSGTYKAVRDALELGYD